MQDRRLELQVLIDLMKACYPLLFLAALNAIPCHAQINPPGLGTANTASWLAIGLRQSLDTVKEWESLTYIGWARKSEPDNRDPFSKGAMFILNQEFYHLFHARWQYSFAASYRRQDEYSDEPPFGHEDPPIRQEFRLYARLYYNVIDWPRLKTAVILREDIRRYLNPGHSGQYQDLQLRTRFRLRITLSLNDKNSRKLIANSEQLFATSRTSPQHSWSEFVYTESRFTFFYSHLLESAPVVFNIGYMNNLVGRESPFDVHFLALDIILVDPVSQDRWRHTRVSKIQK